MKPLRPSDDYDKQDKDENDVWDDQDIEEEDNLNDPEI